MSFLSNYEGQGCGATSKDRPTYPSPPALSSCSLIPLVSSGSALWSKLSILNKSSAPPSSSSLLNCSRSPAEWVHPPRRRGVRICVWSLFSVSTRRLWTSVKVCVKDWAVNWKLWVRAGRSCPPRRPSSSPTNMLGQQPVSEKTFTPARSVIKNNGIICRLRGGNLETLNWFYLFVFSLSCRFHYSSVWNILKWILLCFETENPQQPLRWKTPLWFEMLCWIRHLPFHFRNEHAALESVEY